MPEIHHPCPVAAALREHLRELRQRELQISRMAEEQRGARKTSVSASLQARLRLISLEIGTLNSLLQTTMNGTTEYHPFGPAVQR